MGLSRIPKFFPIITAATANGAGAPQIVNDYRHVMVELTTTGSATLTFKIQGSFQAPEDPPDFSSPPSASNRWFYVHSYNLTAPSAGSNGSTGYSASGTDIVLGVEVNVDGLVWLNVEVSGYSAGSANATGVIYMNQ